MPSPNHPRSSKVERQPAKKTLDLTPDTSSDSSSRTVVDQDIQLQERLKYLQKDIKTLRNDSFSRSIKLGKAKGAEDRDEDLIAELEGDIRFIGEKVASGMEAARELEREIARERRKRHVELLRSLTDTLPRVGGWGAEMDEDRHAENLSSADTAAEELDDDYE